MVMAIPDIPCYLIEWYRQELTAQSIDDIVDRLNAAAATMGLSRDAPPLTQNRIGGAVIVRFGVCSRGISLIPPMNWLIFGVLE